MENQVPNPVPAGNPGNQAQPAMEQQCDRDSHLIFALGVALLVCGQAIFGRHEVTMVGLGLIIFASLFR